VTIFNATDCKGRKIFSLDFEEIKSMIKCSNSPVALYIVLIQTTIFWPLTATGCIGKILSTGSNFLCFVTATGYNLA
jgi:hypothetical protein